MSLWKGWGSWLTEVRILMSSLMPLSFLLSSWPVQRTRPGHDQPTAGWSEADSQEVQGVEGHEHAAAPGHLSPAAGTSGPWRHPPGTQEPQLFWLCWKVTLSRSQDCSLPCSCAILQDTARAYILLTRKPQTQFLRMRPGWSQFWCSGSPGFRVLPPSILELRSSSEQVYLLCSYWELLGALGSRGDVEGVTPSFAFKRIATYHRQEAWFY